MKTINRVGDDADRRVETEAEIRAADIVIDGFGDADDIVVMLAPHVARRAKRAVAADDDQSVETVLLPVMTNLFERFCFIERIGARRAENGAAAWENAGDGTAREWDDVVFDQPAPTVLDAEHLRVFNQCATHDGADSSVETGAIAARSQNPYAETHQYNRVKKLNCELPY